MYKADWNLARKLKEYDPNLYLKWNQRKEWFELWYDMPNKGPKLLTSVTQNIYFPDAPRKYVEPDERLLWWLHFADSHKWGGAKEHTLEHDTRYREFRRRQKLNFKKDMWDRTKEASRLMHNFYYGRKKAPSRSSLGKYPKFDNYEKQNSWVRPDLGGVRSRLRNRSRGNAKYYNFKKAG